MKGFRQSLILIFLVAFCSSCAVIGLNVKRKTPHKPGKYPEFTLEDTLSGQNSRFRKVYDVTCYDLNIDVNVEKKYLSGYVDMYFTANSLLDTIQIDLYENLIIDRIIYLDRELSYSRKYKAVFIRFDEKIRPGEKCKIRVYYEGKPITAPRPPWEGGFVWKKDKDNRPWIGVACELAGASLWWPLKDVLFDEPDSMKLSATIPAGLFCVSNGRLTGRTKQGNRETFSWKTSFPINTFNTTIYIGNFENFQLPYPKKDSLYQLDFYVLPRNLALAKSHFQQSIDILRFYESVFGDYPWWPESYKLIESPYEGMEHQTAIAYGNKYKNQFGNSFDYIILHETAHEWWGNGVSAGDYAEIWLHEGFATYSEALYVENKYGHDAYLRYLAFYSMLIKNKMPLIRAYEVNFWDYKDSDVYMKGALTLHTLRNVIHNDSLFYTVIRTFYERHKYGIATTRDFMDLVNEKTSDNLDWFFQQYLYSRVCPRLEWNYVYDVAEGSYEFRYHWANLDSDFNLPVRLNAGGKDYVIYPAQNVKSIKIDSGEDIQINTDGSYFAQKKDKSL